MNTERIAILSSGGMDSFLTWAHYHRMGIPTVNVFVDLGQKYKSKERGAWSRLCYNVPGFEGISLIGLNLREFETPSGIIPNRNAHLILAAASVSNQIALGVLQGEINSDKSPEFLWVMKLALDISNKGQYWNDGIPTHFQIATPLITLTKSAAVRQYLNEGGVPEFLDHTISCYDADDGHCGACPSCFKRWVALTNNNLPYRFRSDPRIWANVTGVLKKAQDGTYNAERAQEIMTAIDAVRHLPHQAGALAFNSRGYLE